MALDKVAGDSVEERLSKIEGQLAGIDFNSLPLRKLRDFLENEMILDPATNIMGGVDGLVGADGAAGADGATGADGAPGPGTQPYPYEGGIFVPTWPGFGTPSLGNCSGSGGPGGTQQARGTRFYCGAEILITQVGFHLSQAITADAANAAIEIAIYNTDCTSLLTTTGMMDLTGFNVADDEQHTHRSFSPTLTLDPYTRYCLVFYPNAQVQTGLLLGMDSGPATGYKKGVVRRRSSDAGAGWAYTADGIVKYAHNFVTGAAGGLGSSLPADLAAAATSSDIAQSIVATLVSPGALSNN